MSAAGSWDEYHCAMSSITSEMRGAADYLEKNPDYATDEQVAKAFWQFVKRIRDVEVPS